jgi:hypothetical protein
MNLSSSLRARPGDILVGGMTGKEVCLLLPLGDGVMWLHTNAYPLGSLSDPYIRNFQLCNFELPKEVAVAMSFLREHLVEKRKPPVWWEYPLIWLGVLRKYTLPPTNWEKWEGLPVIDAWCKEMFD